VTSPTIFSLLHAAGLWRGVSQKEFDAFAKKWMRDGRGAT